MARTLSKLKPLEVARLRVKGLYGDGGGLYLQVSTAGTKSWVFRFRRNGKVREMGLGSLSTIGLADARIRATQCRRLLLDDIDPIEARHAARTATRLEAARSMTFASCARAFIESHAPAWRNKRHAAQWPSSMDAHVNPVIGQIAVQNIDVAMVLMILEPLWLSKTQTANRVRGRIEAVLDWAVARGFRAKGDNPARWKGHLDQLLPAPSKISGTVHHPALPYGELPAFVGELVKQPGVAAEALIFTILTAARTGEVIGASNGEFDLSGKVWTIPGPRMKAGKAHRVHLARPALEIIVKRIELKERYTFCSGAKRRKPLSQWAMTALLKRMGRSNITVHGFRSSFRDWAAETTDHSREVVEMALAHAIGDKVEAAYRRGDLFEKRRALMDAWAAYCFSNQI